ncbi:hypothetical protein QF036_002232 [Arthrobacter globiformis]|nr:hypothetical protein [Arthrobacter globiformis]
MSQIHGNTGSQSATVMRPRASAGVRRNRFPKNSIQVMSDSPGPTMNRHNSNHEAKRRSQVNTQRPGKEARAEIFSGHVAPASYVHEQVTSTKTADPGTKEPARDTTGHQ